MRKPQRGHNFLLGNTFCVPCQELEPIINPLKIRPYMAAYYATTVVQFLRDPGTTVFAQLVNENAAAKFIQLEHAQTEVWRKSIEFLQDALSNVQEKLPVCLSSGILLEYPIPRLQRRIDLVILARDLIFVVEFKSDRADLAALRQSEDYALDLSHFHQGSVERQILPFVVASKVTSTHSDTRADEFQVHPPTACTYDQFPERIVDAFSRYTRTDASPISVAAWNQALYRPVPTIVEAALSIFSGMEVREIAHAYCEPHNLTATVDVLVDAIRKAVARQEKLICFVTGVPGSGKTLAGLRAVHDLRLRQLTGAEPAFFSGNGPLVKILREALVKDAKRRGELARQARPRINSKIQNIHVMAREAFDDPYQRPQNERVIVFDEAQRAWNAARNKRKFGRDISEPEMILTIMDRHRDWAVLVCLVGGGQEIHDGEAGLSEWGEALSHKLTHWNVLASPEALRGGPSVAGSKLFINSPPIALNVVEEASLHLPVSTRSYRAQAITEWSNSLLKGEIEKANSVIEHADNFPVYITRALGTAKGWLKSMARGSDRCGLVASSGAARLRAYGIETSTAFHRDYPYERWFLADGDDIRSSHQLEVVATEFEIQGLELDWVGLCWGGDFLWHPDERQWVFRRFSGKKWTLIRRKEERQFIANSYRVLLTRARQGMVIWVPQGYLSDPTCAPEPLNDTADALRTAGLRFLTTPNS